MGSGNSCYVVGHRRQAAEHEYYKQVYGDLFPLKSKFHGLVLLLEQPEAEHGFMQREYIGPAI